MIQVNLQAVWVIARDAGRHMLESRGGVSGGEAVAEGAADSNPRGRGKIINIASLISYQGRLLFSYSSCLELTMLYQVVSRFRLTLRQNTVSPVSPRHCPTNGLPRASTSTPLPRDTLRPT